MIPDHIIEKAMNAYIDAEGERCYATSMEAALQAVIPGIWDDAYWAGEGDGRWGDGTLNPYDTSETA